MVIDIELMQFEMLFLQGWLGWAYLSHGLTSDLHCPKRVCSGSPHSAFPARAPLHATVTDTLQDPGVPAGWMCG